MNTGRTRKIVLSVVGVLAVLLGALWMAQGLDIIGGSMMSGQTKYFVIGAILALVGVLLLVTANRRKPGHTPAL